MASSLTSSPSQSSTSEDNLVYGEDRGKENQEEADEEVPFARRFVKVNIPMAARPIPPIMVPNLFTSRPPIRDNLKTETSEIQDETIAECLPFLSGKEARVEYNQDGLPRLDKKRHVAFLHKNLKTLPAPYLAADASRPWFFYWVLNALSTLGEDVTSYGERLISTVRPIQNPTGGFGGGNGQMSHLAPTYAIVLALSIVGGEEALNVIDRKAMWKWLSTLKQPDGGFQMAIGGEEDIRGAYCAAVIITLLDLPLECSHDSPTWEGKGSTLLTGLPEWISRCQTYEGGMSGLPDAEAHGAYAFCALACLCILGEPHVMVSKYLDVPLLISWLSARQYAPEGGYSGRTNKLVDGCYSHWVGGCWPLIEACLEGHSTGLSSPLGQFHLWGGSTAIKPLYSRAGLIRYILCCCQDFSKRGGLRDKPSHTSDSYHTCYVLTGLSNAQNKWFHNRAGSKKKSSGNLSSPYLWSADTFLGAEELKISEHDRVNRLHPVFCIPEGVAERTRDYFASKGEF